jgi:molecular chaperone GrpE
VLQGNEAREGNVTEAKNKTTTQTDQVDGVEENVEPDILEEEDGLEIDEFEQLKSERDDYLDQLQRSRAEFLNYKRRTDQERFALRDLIGRDVLSQFLPVVDDFERALGSLPESERTSSWVSGMELIQTKLKGILERAGVKKVDALNQPFDPKEHEAVATDPGTSGSHVVEVYQAGYKIGDALLRPAMVKTGDPVDEASNDQFNA